MIWSQVVSHDKLTTDHLFADCVKEKCLWFWMFYSFPSLYGLKWIFQVLRPTDACTMSLSDKSKFSAVFSTFHILYISVYLEQSFKAALRRQVLKPLLWNNGFTLRDFCVVWDASDTIVFTQQIQCSHMYVSPKRPCVLLWPGVSTLSRLNCFFFPLL